MLVQCGPAIVVVPTIPSFALCCVSTSCLSLCTWLIVDFDAVVVDIVVLCFIHVDTTDLRFWLCNDFATHTDTLPVPTTRSSLHQQDQHHIEQSFLLLFPGGGSLYSVLSCSGGLSCCLVQLQIQLWSDPIAIGLHDTISQKLYCYESNQSISCKPLHGFTTVTVHCCVHPCRSCCDVHHRCSG